MFTKNFKEIFKKDSNVAGGKGASLGEMTQNNISIPPGFVVLAGAFDELLKETNLDFEIKSALAKVDYKNINSVEKASAKIRDMINDAKVPPIIVSEIIRRFKELKAPFVAVRSSATAEDSSTASWAGELESYMNIKEAGLVAAIKDCWSSLFTPRAIFYAYKKGMDNQHVAVAVVVQKMVQSEVAGIAFTVHPVTEDKNNMVIEAGYGLGEAIVGGEITPDTYVVNKKGRIIIDKNISSQSMMIVSGSGGVKKVKVAKVSQERQKLPDSHIVELADICLRIEKHYKKPQDIEWALEKGKLYIVQSRPITTL